MRKVRMTSAVLFLAAGLLTLTLGSQFAHTSVGESNSVSVLAGTADYPCPAGDKDMRLFCKKGKKSPYCKPGCMQCMEKCREERKDCKNLCAGKGDLERKSCKKECKFKQHDCKQNCPSAFYEVACPPDDKEMRSVCKNGPNVPNCKPGCMVCVEGCRASFKGCKDGCPSGKSKKAKKCRMRCRAKRASCKLDCPNKSE